MAVTNVTTIPQLGRTVMKVLVVSHNLISQTTNMGKTLRSYFRDFSPDEVAQFYIHSEVPVDGSICKNYYRFTDVDAVRSVLLPGNRGQLFGAEDIQEDRKHPREDTGALASAYQVGRKRTAGVYLARELVWKLSRWSNPKLWEWVERFQPDVVFLASGDYGFIYDIAREIADRVNKPLVVSCVDDYYLHEKGEETLFRRIHLHGFMRTVRKTIGRTSALCVICPSMKKEYEKLFGKLCYVLHTPAEKRNLQRAQAPEGIAYLGNVNLGRNEQLACMGRALQKIVDPEVPKYIDVYSGEKDPDILKVLTGENGIHFHGEVSSEQVAEIMNSAAAVIHTESFDEKLRRSVRFSVSTKIPDCMTNGPCLIAYGPEEVASISYLQETGAAWTITDPETLEAKLKEILTNQPLREQIAARARTVAEQNHNIERNSKNVRSWLEQVCREWENHRK